MLQVPLTRCTGVVLFGLFSGQLLANEDGLFELSIDQLLDVTVEARKVSESLQKTPISVSVLSAQQLEQRNLTDLLQAGYFIPNVDVTTVGENSGCTHCANITIRGVGQVDPIPTTDPSVGVYVDGVYFARSAGGITRFLDIEQIEILRGPQGTLFGKNTIGGAVNIHTKKVTNESSVSSRLTLGEFNRKDVSLTINQPLSEKVAMRVAIGKFDREGFVRRINGDREGGEDDFSMLAKLRHEVNDRLTLNWQYNRQTQSRGSAPAVLPAKNDDAVLIQLYNYYADLGQGVDAIEPLQLFADKYTSAGEEVNHNRLQQSGFTLQAEYQFSDEVALKSITAYRKLDAFYSRDFDNNPVNIGVTRDWQTQIQRSQEFNLTGKYEQYDWLLGAYYFDENINYQFDFDFFEGLFKAVEAIESPVDGSPLSSPTDVGGAGNPLNAGVDFHNRFLNDIENTSYAVFAHINYHFSPSWTGILGARYTREEKRQEVVGLALEAGVTLLEQTSDSAEGAVTPNWNVFSPMLGLQYQYSDSVMGYLTVSRGFKSGGFNGVPSSPAAIRPFDPEHLTAMESGIRSSWFDNRLRFNLSAFYMQHKDMQLRGGESTQEGIEIFIDNVGKTRTKGLEWELEALIEQDFGLSLSGAFTRAKFVDVGNATQVTLNTVPIRTPKWSIVMGIWKNWAVLDNKNLHTRLDWSYRSKMYTDVFNSPLAQSNHLKLLNARVQLDISKNMSVSLFANNLTNEYHFIGANDFRAVFGVAEHWLAAPREAGVSLTMKF
ncbi:TonB-dependent receptor [Pseudoalteromonas sp. T1lg65]|uniref:TonB-dependent receptor n=1 Tax=Pseudoalteromonas sp. T1lg65 TaxID=2077101 RepID=UPI003F7B24D2